MTKYLITTAKLDFDFQTFSSQIRIFSYDYEGNITQENLEKLNKKYSETGEHIIAFSKIEEENEA